MSPLVPNLCYIYFVADSAPIRYRPALPGFGRGTCLQTANKSWRHAAHGSGQRLSFIWETAVVVTAPGSLHLRLHHFGLKSKYFRSNGGARFTAHKQHRRIS